MAAEYLLEFYSAFRFLLVILKCEVEESFDCFSGGDGDYGGDTHCYATGTYYFRGSDLFRDGHVFNDTA